ncbi:MAG TPA: helix-turn-helix domain-containing protein [Candidatus Paceibacterota bacterium]
MSNFIKIKDAAKVLGVSIPTLRNWDAAGKFKAHRHPMNNYRVYKVEDLYRIIEEIEISDSSIQRKKDAVKKLAVRHLEEE